MKRKILSFLAAGMLFTLPAAAQSVGVVMERQAEPKGL